MCKASVIYNEVTEKLEDVDKEQIKEYLIRNTLFPKIGEKLNNKEIVNSKFYLESA